MSSDNNKAPSLNAVSVMLVMSTSDSLDYLRNILQFIDCDVQVPGSPDELQRLVERFNDRAVAVFISAQVADAERSAYLAAINACTPRPALIQVQEQGSDEMLVSGEVLGTLRLPCQYDAVSALLHKAQVFDESQRHGESPRRPLELFRSLSGNGRATRNINRMIEQVADSEATVLILGESGTGKEVVARKLHYHSKRRGRPFVPVNCGAIPGDLLDHAVDVARRPAVAGQAAEQFQRPPRRLAVALRLVEHLGLVQQGAHGVVLARQPQGAQHLAADQHLVAALLLHLDQGRPRGAGVDRGQVAAALGVGHLGADEDRHRAIVEALDQALQLVR